LAFDGFPEAVFAVFAIPTFAERMAALRAEVTPRLDALGTALAPALAAAAGHPLYVHVAQHRRRRVHPPDETWVAWGRSARGYKAFVHFEAGVSARGVFARVALKPEAAAERRIFADRLQWDDLAGVDGPGDVLWYRDGSPDDIVPVRAIASAAAFDALRERVRRAQGAVAIGVEVPRTDPVVGQPALKTRLLDVFARLAPLYALGVPASV
jgi:uncharacterized protein YktB (UPF0637 family)